MRKRIATLLASLTAGVALAAAPAVVQAMEPYHIKNSSSSTRFAVIYKDRVCGASDTHVLQPGMLAKSTLWESMRVSYGGGWWVYVYHGTTGELLAQRKYAAGDCVRAYTTNRYFIFAASGTLAESPPTLDAAVTSTE